MIIRNKVKKGLTIVYIAAAMVAVGGILAMRLIPRTVPYEQCSEVYKRYHSVEGVNTSFVKGYELNDTMRIDVTFLEATTDSAWARLKEDFGISSLPAEYGEFDREADEYTITSWRAPKDNPYGTIEECGPRPDDISTAVSHYRRQVCVFHTKNEAELDAVLAYLFNKISPNTPSI